jgi:hypothetical protein
MRDPTEQQKDQAGHDDAVLVLLREKIREMKLAIVGFDEEPSHARGALVLIWNVNTESKNEIDRHDRRRCGEQGQKN